MRAMTVAALSASSPSAPGRRPCIALVATGGTIAGAGTGGGDAPSAAYQSAVVTADALVASVPGLARLADSFM